MRNQAADRFLSLLGDPVAVWKNVDPSGDFNIMRMTFHPQGLQPFIQNWEQASSLLIARLFREVAADPSNQTLRALFEEICGYPGVPDNWRSHDWAATPAPILPLVVGTGTLQLKLFSMISSFGTPLDITAEELRIETFFAVDDATRDFFHALAAQANH